MYIVSTIPLSSTYHTAPGRMLFKIAGILYIILSKYYNHSTSILGSNHPKPLQDINVNTSHHVCTNILTVTTSSAGISHIATSVELLEVKNIFFFISESIRHRKAFAPSHRNHKLILLYLCVLLLNQSLDINPNPGPTLNETKYDCCFCHTQVIWSDKGIMCASCDQWYHTSCQGVGNETYNMLSDRKHIWYCLRCALPSYSNGLFESLDTLSDTNMLDSLHLDISTYSDIIDQPQAT